MQDLGKVVSENAGHLLLRGEDEGGALKELTAEQRAAMGMTARRINLHTMEVAICIDGNYWRQQSL